MVTPGAYQQVKQQLRPELFVKLNRLVVNDFYRVYEAERNVRRWHGRRLCGVQTKDLNPPAFSAVCCYDLLNNVALAAGLGPKPAEPRILAEILKTALKPGDVVVRDWCDPDHEMIAIERRPGSEFIVRFERHCSGIVDQFWQSDETDRIVELEWGRCRQSFARDHRPLDPRLVRLVKVELVNGEIRVLGTSLLNAAQDPPSRFKEVYDRRWGGEIWIDRLENIFESERFGEGDRMYLEQEFHGLIFLASLESILSRGDELLRASGHRTMSYLTLVHHAVSLLLDPLLSLEQVLEELHRLLRIAALPPPYARPFAPEEHALGYQIL